MDTNFKSKLFFTIISFIFAINMLAQDLKIGENYIVKINEFDIVNDSVKVDVILALLSKKTNSIKADDYSIIIENGNNTLELPKIKFEGKVDSKSFKRLLSLKNKSQLRDYKLSTPYKFMHNYKVSKSLYYVDYSYSLPYESWMANSFLVIKVNNDNYGKELNNFETISSVPIKFLDNIDNTFIKNVNIVNNENNSSLEYITSLPISFNIGEEFTENIIKIESRIDFDTYSTSIDPYLRDNSEQLNNIIKTFNYLFDNDNIEITKIFINGYSSPDGPLLENQKLSQKRAKSIMSLLLIKYPSLRSSMFNINFVGENWDDLIYILKKSNMKFKDEVLEIIAKYSINQYREKRIMDLHDGLPWKYMVRNYFPELRKVEIAIHYTKKEELTDYLKEIEYYYNTQPNELSLNDFYLIANSLEVGSAEYNRLFDVAARYYPNEDIILINAGIGAFNNNDINKAKFYLNRVQNKTYYEYYLAMKAIESIEENN